MRNRRLGRKLGVKTKHRKAMLRNMVTELFRHGQIRTTDAKAKELKRVADKIVTLAKKSAKEGAANGGLSFKRRIFGYITDKSVARGVFTEIAERFRQRPGGYSRIISLGYRRGDRTPISRIELVTEDYSPAPKKNKTRKSNLPAPVSGKAATVSGGPSESSAPAKKDERERPQKPSGTGTSAPAGKGGSKEGGEKTPKPEDAKPERSGGEK